MNTFDATEQAYKRGYEDGRKAGDMPDIYRAINGEALQTYGLEAQVRQFSEEFSECFIELNKFVRGRSDCDSTHLAEELADVSIMVDQMVEHFHMLPQFRNWRERKYMRLGKRLGFSEEELREG